MASLETVKGNGRTIPFKGGRVKAQGKGKTQSKGKAKKVARTVDPKKLDDFGLRKGSKKSLAAAMYASKRGATLNEVKDKLDSTQFNVLRQLRAQGYKVKESKEKGIANRQVTRYTIIC